MSVRILHIQNNGSSETFELNKDRIIAGRDKKCDIFLEDTEISRKHFAILNKFGVIYIENISSTGQIIVDGKAVEFAELGEKQIVQIGPYKLFWSSSEESDIPSPSPVATNEAPEDNNNLEDVVMEIPESPAENAELEAFEAPQTSELPEVNDAVPQMPENLESLDMGEEEENGQQGTAALLGDLQNDINNVEPNDSKEPSLSLDNADAPLDEPSLGASQSTQILDSVLPAVLKMTKGEFAGKEFMLENSVEWNVGRGSKNEVQIESQKISRQHFKIIRVGPGFRIVDLGSSNGTKVNGVAVSDSPLNSFDTIQAGQIEFQFLIGNPENPNTQALIANTGAGTQPTIGQKTQNNLSLNLGLGSATQQGDSPFAIQKKTANNTTVPGIIPSAQTRFTRLELTGAARNYVNSQRGFVSSNESSKDTSLSVYFKKFSEMPAPRKFLILLVFVLGAGIALEYQNASPDLTLADSPQTQSERTPASTPESPKAGIAVSTTVTTTDASEDFLNLSDQEKAKIEELYQVALNAQNSEDWSTAYDAATKIKSKVKRYKNSNDIIFNAQNKLNEDSLLSITQAAESVDEAKSNNAEILSLSLSEGEKALADKRWADAAENFNRALVLDPSNSVAKMGLEKALAQDIAAAVNTPDAKLSADGSEGVDPNLERLEFEKDYIKSLKTKFQDARNKINASSFGRALKILREIDRDLKAKTDELSDSGRTPASIKTDTLEDARLLLVKVKEASDLARTQLLTEYQTQMSDADELIQNKQYPQARDIYDRILKVEPEFEDVRELRNKLYSKIIVEARNSYQEALIYEAVGDLDEALNGFLRSKELLVNVREPTALEYLRRTEDRLDKLKGVQR
jgi:pSer/pThr/pTyr-binding forkhead associated (FHA) protein